MRRLGLLLASLTVLGAAAPAWSVETAEEPPPLRAALTACETGPGDGQRFATFTGSMPALPGTQRMAMRFDLLRRRAPRPDGRGFRRVPAPGLGQWERSEPGRAGFIFTKTVEALGAPATYRATVRFRWYAADGRLQRDVRRRTPVCRQPDQRPDLRVTRLVVGPDERGEAARHAVTVVNEGRTPAPSSQLAVRVGQDVPALAVVGPLPPGESATVSVDTGACGLGPVSAVADANRSVDEADEGDNALSRSCR